MKKAIKKNVARKNVVFIFHEKGKIFPLYKTCSFEKIGAVTKRPIMKGMVINLPVRENIHKSYVVTSVFFVNNTDDDKQCMRMLTKKCVYSLQVHVNLKKLF